MWKDKKVATVRVTTEGRISCDRYTTDPMDNPLPFDLTADSLNHFFESRCFPRTRANAKEILKQLGLSYYTPLGIVRKTYGLQLDDFYWIRFKGEEVQWDSIKLRD